MFIIRLILLVLGAILIAFGYLIYFRKKYNLINNFEKDFELNRFNESYANRIGLIELIWGIMFIVFFFATKLVPDYSIGFLVVGVIGLILSLISNYLKSSRN